MRQDPSAELKPRPTVLANGSAADSHDGIDIFALLSTLLRRRFVIVALSLITAAGLVAAASIQRPTFVSRAAILPETRQGSNSNFAGVAAQLGLVLPVSNGGQSPAFYADLVESRTILSRVAADTVSVRADGREIRAPLSDVLDVRAPTAALRRDRTIKRLRSMVSSALTAKTSVISVDVRAHSPDVAGHVAQRIVDELARFNVETRRTQAANERRFAAERLAEVTAELRGAENALQDFLQRNRGDFRRSPALGLEHDRLARQVTLKSQTQTTLAQALEQARIEEVRDTPVLTVVESPEVPLSPEPRGRVRKGIIGLALGAFLGIILAFVLDSARSASAEAGSFEEFVRLRGEAFASIRRPLQVVARMGRRRPVARQGRAPLTPPHQTREDKVPASLYGGPK
jgi:uncharacterized protein involved in exopolysaccharide biosynthesis